MKITGRILKTLPLQTGQGKKGEWKKQSIIIETEGEYSKKICFDCWNKLAENLKGFKKDDLVTIEFNVESREYNEKWFTNVSAWKIEKAGNTQTTQQTQNQQPQPQEQENDNLPF
ncbi:MAG: DUF3127 domain-containing protein [Deltaproteobacteria bacterium]|nr:DUF3127 domain-containing protein [Deltaproteobacteria bacterium]